MLQGSQSKFLGANTFECGDLQIIPESSAPNINTRASEGELVYVGERFGKAEPRVTWESGENKYYLFI